MLLNFPYLIISSLSATSRSCSAFSRRIHALSMSCISCPSGGVYNFCPLAFNLACMLKNWASMFPLSLYLCENSIHQYITHRYQNLLYISPILVLFNILMEGYKNFQFHIFSLNIVIRLRVQIEIFWSSNLFKQSGNSCAECEHTRTPKSVYFIIIIIRILTLVVFPE